ncbi:hypothetical protein BFW86_08970 [Pseudomonas fluorescens]|nr:hypothetical protein BFW86_08970 [Pseudomonas fluorescens]
MTNGINNSGFRSLLTSNTPSAQGGQQVSTAGGGYSRQGIDARTTGTQPLQSPLSSFPFIGGRSSANRHVDNQNFFGAMHTPGNPYISSDDHLLASALKNNFSLLEKFQKDGHLDQKALQQVADEDPNNSTVSERTIMLAREILNRPRLNEAITQDGTITRDSLSKAADLMVGNTNPNTQSADPYHAKTDAQVVQAFSGMFDDLRDKSQDYSFFFEKHRYVKKDTLIEMSKDPDEITANGEAVRDPATGFPKKKYSEQQVYLAKNLVERPGLLASLDSTKANGSNIFGSHNNDGWLKNYSIERWLENDRKEKSH